MAFTTAEGLQDTIDTIKLSTEHRTLNLLVSPEVPEISFHVPSHFSQLKVLRCVKHRGGKHRGGKHRGGGHTICRRLFYLQRCSPRQVAGAPTQVPHSRHRPRKWRPNQAN